MEKQVSRKIDFNKAKEEKKILTGLVTDCKIYNVSETEKANMLEIKCLGNKVCIEEDEIVVHSTKATPKSLVGEKAHFTVIDIVDDVVFGSMREAKEILEKPILDKLKAGEVMKGIITYITPYGVYINIDGVLSGMMKNEDFSDDGTEIREVYEKYAVIRVKYKKTTSNGNILFVPEKKRPTKNVKYKLSDIKKNDIYLGTVTDIHPTGTYIKVSIDNSLAKVKCYFPKIYPNLKIGDIVTVKITSNNYNEEENRYYIHGVVRNRVEQYVNEYKNK